MLGGISSGSIRSFALLFPFFEPFEDFVNIILVEHFVERLHEVTEIPMVHEGRFQDSVLFDNVGYIFRSIPVQSSMCSQLIADCCFPGMSSFFCSHHINDCASFSVEKVC